MKNSQLKEPKPKVNLKDITDGTKMRETPIFIANGIEYWAIGTSKDQLSTHRDCIDCGVEFEKEYTYDKRCFNCQRKAEAEDFAKMELVDWDGKSVLCIYGTDTYFFSEDDILMYCEDHKIEPDQLRLVLCTETSYSTINICDLVQDDVHEDWEPSDELIKLETALNDYLKKASTNTWTAGNKRVLITSNE